MGDENYTLTPRDVPAVETKYRRIKTPIPVPESIPVFETLLRYEPVSMSGQPPILWDHAEGAARKVRRRRGPALLVHGRRRLDLP